MADGHSVQWTDETWRGIEESLDVPHSDNAARQTIREAVDAYCMANIQPRATPPASAVRDMLDKIKKATATLAEALAERTERFSPEWEEWQAVRRHLHAAASAWRPSEQQRVPDYLEGAIKLAAKILPAEEFDAPLGPGNPNRFLHRLDEVL